MSREIDRIHIKPLHNEFDALYTKYSLLCSIDYKQFEYKDRYDKSRCSYAFEMFKFLKSDFESVFHELKTLERYVADEEKSE